MKEVVLSGEDLFFLSRIMKAKYMDYDYVKMLSELSSRYALKESIALDNLSNKGLVYEDFSGDVEVEDLGRELFEPIFFGEFESELVIEDRETLQRYKFHVLNNRYIQVKIEDNMLYVKEINKEDILDYLPFIEDKETTLLPLDYFEDKELDGIMVLKRQKVNGQSKCIQLVNEQGVFYKSRGLKITSLTKQEIKELIKTIIWEE